MLAYELASPAANRAIQTLADFLGEPHTKSIPASRYGALAYKALDIMPDAITIKKLANAAGNNKGVVGDILRAFRGQGLLLARPDASTPQQEYASKKYLPILHRGSPALIDFAADYNALFATHIQNVCPLKVTPKDLSLRAIRSYASARNIRYAPMEEPGTIVHRTAEHTASHPQSVIYRSLATCAFAMDVLGTAEANLSNDAAQLWKNAQAYHDRES